jgi:superfamily I DNA/RNA helicase
MTPSIKQEAIYDCWRTEDSNILINAVAGSGKTTTLLELLRMCRHRTLFLAFNKSIQTEIQDIININNLGQGKAMTMHSLGLQAIKHYYKKFRINNNKNYELVKIIQEEHKLLFKELKWEDKVKLSYTLMDMNDVSRIYLTDDIELIRSHMIGMDKNFFDIKFEGRSIINILWEDFLNLREQRYKLRPIEIDFHDMIYIPVKENLTIPIYPYYLMVDEAQDLNIAQHALINKLLSQGTIRRWIAVGDKNQAIYGFSGAYSSSFDKFAQKDNVKQLPLDICYRCPVDVINCANEVYNVMEGFKREPGIVKTISSYTQIKDESMIICRNSSPLFDLYFRLLGDNRKVYIKGEDILGSVIKFLKPYTYKTISVAKSQMSRQLKKLEQDINKSDNDRFKYYKYKSNFEDFLLISNEMCEPYDTINELIQRFKEIFENTDGDAIVLCTIHKSKGLEADVVYIVNEHLIPSKFARSSKQLQQEQNLKYVARTRAKKELYFLNI